MTTGSKDDTGFLSRWSQRKTQAADGIELDMPAETAEEPDVPEPETEDEAMELLKSRDPDLAEQIADIDIDKLSYDDDFTIFMKAQVPEFLRRRALSKLWLSNPVLANLDGLNEYDEDYRFISSGAGAIQAVAEKIKDKLASDDTGKGDQSVTGSPTKTEDEVRGTAEQGDELQHHASSDTVTEDEEDGDLEPG